jgi:hypothetical protein
VTQVRSGHIPSPSSSECHATPTSKVFMEHSPLAHRMRRPVSASYMGENSDAELSNSCEITGSAAHHHHNNSTNGSPSQQQMAGRQADRSTHRWTRACVHPTRRPLSCDPARPPTSAGTAADQASPHTAGDCQRGAGMTSSALTIAGPTATQSRPYNSRNTRGHVHTSHRHALVTQRCTRLQRRNASQRTCESLLRTSHHEKTRRCAQYWEGSSQQAVSRR